MRHLILVTFILSVGCAAGRGTPVTYSRPGAIAAAPKTNRLAEIQQGMSPHAVKKILGEPDDVEERHVTGKVWIPFYFGDDLWEEMWAYKGKGRVVFSGGIFFSTAVYEIELDPSEPGYTRR